MRRLFQQSPLLSKAVVLSCWLQAGAHAAKETEAPKALPAPPDFAHQIAPAIKELCGDCHLGDKKKGGFSMNTQPLFLAGSENGPVLDPKNPSSSKILNVLLSTDPDTVMPPRSKDRKPPTPEQIHQLQKWVRFCFAHPLTHLPLYSTNAYCTVFTHCLFCI